MKATTFSSGFSNLSVGSITDGSNNVLVILRKRKIEDSMIVIQIIITNQTWGQLHYKIFNYYYYYIKNPPITITGATSTMYLFTITIT